MRKEFTMRCNEEQFQSVLPSLDQYGIDYSEVNLDNDKCFVMFNPFSNSIKSISSKVAIGLVKEVIFFDRFHFNTFIGRISGLDWLEPQKQTLEDLKEIKKPYPPSMADMFLKNSKAEFIITPDQVNESRGQILGCDARIGKFDSAGIKPVKLKGEEVYVREKSYDKNSIQKYFETTRYRSGIDPAIEGGDVSIISEEGEDMRVKEIRDNILNNKPADYTSSDLLKDLVKDSDNFANRFKQTEFHISFFPKKESPISSGINISAGNAALAYMEFKKTHPEIEPFCIHDKSQL